MRVLVVDTDAPRRALLAHYLAWHGCLAVQASDDQAAQQVLAQGGIHLTIRGEEIDRSITSLPDFVDKALTRFTIESRECEDS